LFIILLYLLWPRSRRVTNYDWTPFHLWIVITTLFMTDRLQYVRPTTTIIECVTYIYCIFSISSFMIILYERYLGTRQNDLCTWCIPRGNYIKITTTLLRTLYYVLLLRSSSHSIDGHCSGGNVEQRKLVSINSFNCGQMSNDGQYRPFDRSFSPTRYWYYILLLLLLLLLLKHLTMTDRGKLRTLIEGRLAALYTSPQIAPG